MIKKSAKSVKGQKDLYKAMLELKTVDECKSFFRDLCTVSEIRAMSERLQVVKMLNDNMTYREISKKLGASTATITRVAIGFIMEKVVINSCLRVCIDVEISCIV